MAHTSSIYRLLRAAALMALAALVLMAWGVFDPRPIALVIAMSVGQALGTLSLAGFLFVVVLDIRRARLFSREATRFSGAPPKDDPGGS